MRLCVKNRHKRHFYIRLSILTVLVILTIFFVIRLEPVFWNKVETYAIQAATDSINSAIVDVFNENNITYNELVTLRATDKNKVSAIEHNSISMNLLRAKLCEEIDNRIYEYAEGKLSIKLGTVLGSPLFSGLGPNIKIKISPSNHAIIEFKDSIIQGGINQVKHSIYMLVLVNINITTATAQKSSNIELEIPVADTVIIGEVPNYYGFGNTSFIGVENGTDKE